MGEDNGQPATGPSPELVQSEEKLLRVLSAFLGLYLKEQERPFEEAVNVHLPEFLEWGYYNTSVLRDHRTELEQQFNVDPETFDYVIDLLEHPWRAINLYVIWPMVSLAQRQTAYPIKTFCAQFFFEFADTLNGKPLVGAREVVVQAKPGQDPLSDAQLVMLVRQACHYVSSELTKTTVDELHRSTVAGALGDKQSPVLVMPNG